MYLPPKIWGQFFWHTIHIVALGYSATPNYTDKKSAKDFYESLAFLIPCPVCKEHYKENLQKNPITPYLDSRKDLIQWTIDIHNTVNIQLGKPTWTLSEVLHYYERLGTRDRSPIWTRDDMNEIDYRSFIKGFLSGSFIISSIAGIYYYSR
jgi:hypothetical protein